MIVSIGNDYVVTHNMNNTVYDLGNSHEWSLWMRTTQNLSLNTVRSFMKSMERFWIWSLYFKVEEDEKFPTYLSRYRETLLVGFEIKESITINNKDNEVVIYTSKPMKKVTINKELAGIKSYLTFTEDLGLIEDSDSINHQYENAKSNSSFLSSVGVKASSTFLELYGKRREFVKAYSTSKRNSTTQKYFPSEHFDSLLDVAQPRERLIYLLCGACSTRISQALNLTLYDIDYENKEVWLLDPSSDDVDLYGNNRREWLKDTYSIDVKTDKPHNSPDLQFKYPIPCEYEPLNWISDKYKNLFFETLVEYTKSKYYLPESARMPMHPFMFVSKNGNRIRAREINARMKKTSYKIALSLGVEDDLNKYSLHSLRHMYGHLMATLYGKTNIDSLIMITKNAMGHRRLESTMVYFNMDYETKKEVMRKAKEKLDNKHKIDYSTGEFL